MDKLQKDGENIMKKLVKLSLFLSVFMLFFNFSMTFTTSQNSVLPAISVEVSDANAVGSRTISNMFATTSLSGNQILGRLCKALNGYIGWMIILFGGVLGAWEYFVQRQGHLLVAIVIGVVAIIFLGKILKVVAKDNTAINCD